MKYEELSDQVRVTPTFVFPFGVPTKRIKKSKSMSKLQE